MFFLLKTVVFTHVTTYLGNHRVQIIFITNFTGGAQFCLCQSPIRICKYIKIYCYMNNEFVVSMPLDA